MHEHYSTHISLRGTTGSAPGRIAWNLLTQNLRSGPGGLVGNPRGFEATNRQRMPRGGLEIISWIKTVDLSIKHRVTGVIVDLPIKNCDFP